MIDDLRKQIDGIDDKILGLLVDRFALVVQVGTEKKEAGIEVVDIDREDTLMNRLVDMAQEKNLSLDLVEKIYQLIIQESRRQQD